MVRKRQPEQQPVEAHQFQSAGEIDSGIKKLERRIEELEHLDVQEVIIKHTGADDVVRSNIRETIRDVFGSNSPEFHEHEHLDIWAGSMHVNMTLAEVIHGTENGKKQVLGILRGLVGRLKEKREELIAKGQTSPVTYFEHLNLHPRIAEVANDLYKDGYHWEEVFAAAKALVNYVRERSGRHDLDGAALMRTVFSRNNPLLAFNDLSDQTDLDEQEGMMHLFEGAVLAIRNPGGHTFPEGTEQRAMEYISLLSLLAYRVQEAKRSRSE